MDEKEDWLKKRMADIPKPIAAGNAGLTEDQLNRGRKDLEKLIKEATKKKNGY